MRKTNIIVLLLLFICVQISAQEDEVKKEKVYTPEAGDFAIGIDARPFIDLVGNMFNNTVNQTLGNIGGDPIMQSVFGNDPSLKSLFPTVSITGKYMLTDQLGIRANIGFIVNKTNYGVYVQDDAAFILDPLSEQEVIDRRITNSAGGSIALGAEYRIGKGRLQGVFSGSALYSFAMMDNDYQYGNGITDVNQKPTIGVGGGYDGDYRVIKKFNTAPVHQFGLIGAVGIEWFIAKKISIGAEVNLALLYAVTPQTYSVVEGYNTTTSSIENRTNLTAPQSSQFVFGTENVGANIFFNFFF